MTLSLRIPTPDMGGDGISHKRGAAAQIPRAPETPQAVSRLQPEEIGAATATRVAVHGESPGETSHSTHTTDE